MHGANVGSRIPAPVPIKSSVPPSPRVFMLMEANSQWDEALLSWLQLPTRISFGWELIDRLVSAREKFENFLTTLL